MPYKSARARKLMVTLNDKKVSDEKKARMSDETRPSIVAGHSVTPVQRRVFELWCTTPKISVLARTCRAEGIDVSAAMVSNWIRSAWWCSMADDEFTASQNRLKLFIARNIDAVESTFLDVASGADKSDKTANARARILQLTMEAGKDPLIQKKGVQITNTTNTQNNSLTVTREIFDRMNQEELNEYNRTGQIPESVQRIEVKEDGDDDA